MSEIYQLIEAEKANYPIVKMCAWAEVSRSGFYEWRDRPVSAAEQRRIWLCERIRVLFERHDETYGHRRIHAALLKQGVEVARETVRQLMRRMGLTAVQPRAYRPTTLSGGNLDGIADLVCRRFEAERPGQLLVGDITYLKSWQGWVYLATVIDVATRQVIGWAMAEHMRASLVVQALDMAARNYTLESGCVFHSDRGSQYASNEFRKALESHDMRQSMGRTGVCWDNALAESFFGVLKTELVYRRVYPTRKKMIRSVARYIETWYNRRRLHSALGYRTPQEAYEEFQAAKQAA